MKYFKNPVQAVEFIKELLISNNWIELSRYYHLNDDDGVDHQSLASGDFFVGKTRPESFHPGEYWKYKHPFPPQFDYLMDQEISSNIIEVTVCIEIDQGDGMIQQGQKYFYLVKSSNGYQILPISSRPVGTEQLMSS